MRYVLPALVLGLAVAFAGCGGCTKEEPFTPTKELASQSIVRDGGTWRVKFTSIIDAPVDKVYDAFAHPERLREFAPENVLKSEVVSESGNQKTVDVVFRLDSLPPGFKVQDIRLENQLDPAAKKITAKSVDFKLADLAMEYVLTPAADGKGTLVTFTQTSKDKASMIVESLQKGALREQYVVQVKAVNKALGLGGTPAAGGAAAGG